MPRPWAPLHVLCATLAAAGCRVSTPEPLPDAARESGAQLLVSPDSLVIRPGGSGRIRFQARDQASLRPLAYYPVDFAYDPPDGTDVRLSTLRSLTDPSGETVVEVIVGPLASRDRPVDFWVIATCPGATPAQSHVLVTTNAYSVEVIPVPADDLLAPGQLATTRLYFYDSAACADVDLYDIDSSLDQARTPVMVAPNSSYRFQGVAASGVHAVVGLGLDSAETVVAGGCADIPGAALLEAETMRATLVLDRLFPAISGAFALSSEFQLNPPPPALAAILSAWQQWQRCPYDPARLWLDCTLAAVGPEPSSCVPQPGSAGTLADLVAARRGTVVAPLPGTLAAATDTPCHGSEDSQGNPSLEVAIDALFTNARGQLTAAALGAFPAELATLLDDVRFSSRLSLADVGVPNTYWAEHRLLAVTFPHARSPITLGIDEPLQPGQHAVLAVPTPATSGIVATFRAGQLFLPTHALTLRLGAAARCAFEIASLPVRDGAQRTDAFVESVFALAQSSDQHTTLLGCAAFDAAVCDDIGQPRGCIVQACRAGLDALSRRLIDAFDGLDGIGPDFRLSGSAPVIDLDNDGRADGLGAGLWSAMIEARGGTHGMWGTWSATQDPASR